MPSWVPYMIASCLAATIIGYILGWAVDEWKNK
jgi:hypothetical protein